MGLTESLLIALWAGFASYDDQGPQMLRRPLLVGPVVGIILGDIQEALIVSATLELMWMGLGNMAGYKTPDVIVGTIVGTTFAITTGQGIAAGVATATTVAILSQQFELIVGMLRNLYAPWADKISKTGEFDGLLKINYVSIALQFMIRFLPVFLFVYFGHGVVDAILHRIPENILAGLATSSKILPAVGLSILMTLMMKDGMWAFLLFGFALTTYLGLGILPITLISFIFAILYTWIMETKQNSNNSDEGGLDL